MIEKDCDVPSAVKVRLVAIRVSGGGDVVIYKNQYGVWFGFVKRYRTSELVHHSFYITMLTADNFLKKLWKLLDISRRLHLLTFTPSES